MTIKGSLEMSIPIVKAFYPIFSVKSKIGPKFSFLRGKLGGNIKFRFRDCKKAHPCAIRCHLTY